MADQPLSQSSVLIAGLLGCLIAVVILSMNTADSFGVLDVFGLSVAIFLFVAAILYGPLTSRHRVLYLLLVALFLRLISLGYNDVVHADLIGYALTIESVWEQGHWWLDGWITAPHPDAVTGTGYLQPNAAIGAYLLPLLLYPLTGNGFLALKVASLVSGLVLLVLVYLLARRTLTVRAAEYLLALTVLSLPFIDYAANGSSYSLTLSFILAYLLLLTYRLSPAQATLFGLFAGIAPFFHFFLILVPLSLLLLWMGSAECRSQFARARWHLVGGIILGLLLTVSLTGVATTRPDAVSSLLTVQLPVFLSSPNVYAHQDSQASFTATQGSLLSDALRGMRILIAAIPLVAFPLLVYGASTLWPVRRSRTKAASIVLIGIISLLIPYFVFFFGWAGSGDRLRYLLPLLFIAYALISRALSTLPRTLTAAVLFFLVHAAVSGLMASPHTYYYGPLESYYLADYGVVEYASTYLLAQPSGTILSLTRQADGGALLFYETRYPFLQAHRHVEFGNKNFYGGVGVDAEVVSRLASDFNVSYVFADDSQTELIPPGYQLTYRRGEFRLYTRR